MPLNGKGDGKEIMKKIFIACVCFAVLGLGGCGADGANTLRIEQREISIPSEISVVTSLEDRQSTFMKDDMVCGGIRFYEVTGDRLTSVESLLSDRDQFDTSMDKKQFLWEITADEDLKNADPFFMSSSSFGAIYEVTYKNAEGEETTHYYFIASDTGFYDVFSVDSRMQEGTKTKILEQFRSQDE